MQNVTHPIPADGDYRIRGVARRRTLQVFAVLGLLVSLFASMTLAQARPPDSEIYALETIGADLNAYSTTTNVWNNHHGWTVNTPPDDPCGLSWFGVQCDAAGNHITGLLLANNNVHGTLADSSVWANLPQLTDISLSNNFISGTIPDLSVLPNLVNFIIVGDTDAFGQFPAYLTGSIPSLTALTQLQTFSVNSNHLTGSIPDLSTLTNLSTFDVSSNQLTGSIPDLTHNTQLNIVSFKNNSLTGSLPALAQMTELFRFEAGGNYLTGSIPPIVSLQYLNRFYVNNNQLTGPMPDIHNMPALDDIDLSYNQLSGPIECLGLAPPCSSGLSILVAIDVSHNQLGGPFPTLDGLGSLQIFRVSYNRITGPIKAMPAQQQQMLSEVCPNPMNLAPQPGIDDYWPSTIQGNPIPWWGPAGANNSCDLILRAEFD